MILDSQKNTQRLSEPTRLPLPSYHRGRIVHISWGRAIITSDLAVIDESGGISIWSTKVALNQLDLQQFYPPYRNAIHDPVIGLEWLPAIPMGRLVSTSASYSCLQRINHVAGSLGERDRQRLVQGPANEN